MLLTSYQIPQIKPVSKEAHRPLWSVMIPVYNQASCLQQALESVLVQDLGPAKMQIEVIDDCSRDNPAFIVDKISNGRISFYQQPNNAGAIANFNTCIMRARGQLIHILHADDYIAPGFYEAISKLAVIHKQAALLMTRAIIVDRQGGIDKLSPRIISLENGSRDASFLFYTNPIRTPAVVIRRRFYENNGGFCPQLAHTADWEMWARAITRAGGAMLNKPLAYYRHSEDNQTSYSMKKGENLLDLARLGEFFAANYSSFDKRRFKQFLADTFFTQLNMYKKRGDIDAVRANEAIWREIIFLPDIIKKKMKGLFYFLKNIVNFRYT